MPNDPAIDPAVTAKHVPKIVEMIRAMPQAIPREVGAVDDYLAERHEHGSCAEELAADVWFTLDVLEKLELLTRAG